MVRPLPDFQSGQLPQTCPSPSPALPSVWTETLLAAAVCAAGDVCSACSSLQPPRVPSSCPWANPGCKKLSKSPKVTRVQTPVSLTPPSQGDPERQVDWVEINDSELGAQDETQGCLFGLQAGTEEATSLSAPLCLPEHGENIFYLAVENQTSVGKCWKDYS